MRVNRLLAALGIGVIGTVPAAAFPTCPAPRAGLHITLSIGVGEMSETERLALYEQQLRARGIHAENTRFWNECLQTFVTENGHVKMRFYDPDTLEEVN